MTTSIADILENISEAGKLLHWRDSSYTALEAYEASSLFGQYDILWHRDDGDDGDYMYEVDFTQNLIATYDSTIGRYHTIGLAVNAAEQHARKMLMEHLEFSQKQECTLDYVAIAK